MVKLINTTSIIDWFETANPYLVNKFHQQLIDLKIDHQYAIAKDADHDYREVINKLDFNPFNFWKNSFLQIGKRSE